MWQIRLRCRSYPGMVTNTLLKSSQMATCLGCAYKGRTPPPWSKGALCESPMWLLTGGTPPPIPPIQSQATDHSVCSCYAGPWVAAVATGCCARSLSLSEFKVDFPASGSVQWADSVAMLLSPSPPTYEPLAHTAGDSYCGAGDCGILLHILLCCLVFFCATDQWHFYRSSSLVHPRAWGRGGQDFCPNTSRS